MTTSSLNLQLPAPGARPGTLVLPSGSAKPRVNVIIYSPTFCEAKQQVEIGELDALMAKAPEDCTVWVDVQGLGEEEPLRAIAERFDIHPLALEDAVNAPQRAKHEAYPGLHLVVARAPWMSEDGDLKLPQAAIFVCERHVISFQERYLGFFDHVRQRIRDGVGPIRSHGAGYLAYALLDSLVDHFFPVVDKLVQAVDELEEEVFDHPEEGMLQRLHSVRRSLTNLRRIASPQREMLRDLHLRPNQYLGEELRSFLRDTYDHASQLVDVIDGTRDLARSLVEVFMSDLAHRQNEVMKVLTLMASVFIPLTFIAGIYGMNFENMPELKSGYGYFSVLFVMIGVAGAMLLYFWRRGWLRGGGS